MPPKVDVSILIAKRDSTIVALYELLEEFQVLYKVQPVLSTLENVYKEMEIKYRSVKKQQETITDRLIETGSTEEQLKANQQVGDKVRGDFLKYSEIFATYQKACNSQEPPLKHDALEAMTTAVTKMADVLGSQKTASHGLEKLSVPTWDGNRKSYATWKSEFSYWMYKYKQDEDEQLQRHQRKLMDTLLNEITNLKPIENGSNSLLRFAARILSFVNNMEHNGCAVTSTSEAPFVMSQLLSKLDASDNIEFGREMLHMGKEENVLNLIDWLTKKQVYDRASKDTNYRNNSREHRFDNNANDSGLDQDEKCPLGCKTKHLLGACPMYQKSTVDEKWEL